MRREQKSDVNKILENREQADEVTTFSPTLSVWGGEGSKLGRASDNLSKWSQVIGCEPYKEQHTLRSPSPLHHRKRRSALYSSSHPSLAPSAKLGRYHLNVMTAVVGSGIAHSPSPLLFEHAGSQASRLQHQNQNPILSFFCETHQALHPHGAFISCEMHPS